MPETTYYAVIDDDHPVDRPAGVVRRIHTEPMPTDEVFTRSMEWKPTEFLQLHRLGHDDEDYVEITEEHADAVIAEWRRRATDRT